MILVHDERFDVFLPEKKSWDMACRYGKHYNLGCSAACQFGIGKTIDGSTPTHEDYRIHTQSVRQPSCSAWLWDFCHHHFVAFLLQVPCFLILKELALPEEVPGVSVTLCKK